MVRRVEVPTQQGSATPESGRAGAAIGGAANVGGCLRQLRVRRGHSLRALAERSGLAVNTLSLIENGKVSPSVSTLQRLALTLGVPIAAFFEVQPMDSEIVHLRSDRRVQVSFAHGLLEDLGAGMAERTIEPFLITLEPHADSGPTPVVHTGQEFVYCLEGQIEYVVDGQAYVLEPGDSLLFDANLPHCWLNRRPVASKALMVICPFEAREKPALRHFGMGEKR